MMNATMNAEPRKPKAEEVAAHAVPADADKPKHLPDDQQITTQPNQPTAEVSAGEDTTGTEQTHSQRELILEYIHVSARNEARGILLNDVSLKVHAGEIALIQLPQGTDDPGLAALSLGITEHESGHIRFLGREWHDNPNAERDRNRIARVYQSGGWLTDLTIQENMTLAQQFHTRKKHRAILDQALKWAKRLELDSIPDQRTQTFRQDELKQFQFVRALFAEPKLLLLEEPMEDVPDELLDVLLNGVLLARQEYQPAIVWITTDPRVQSNKKLKSISQNYVLRNQTLSAVN